MSADPAARRSSRSSSPEARARGSGRCRAAPGPSRCSISPAAAPMLGADRRARRPMPSCSRRRCWSRAPDQAEAVGAGLAQGGHPDPRARGQEHRAGDRAGGARRSSEDDLLLVLPSDHLVGDPAGFHDAVRRARPFARGRLDRHLRHEGRARPRPAIGYIERGAALGEGVHQAVRFVEKPDAATAGRYAAGGRHDWNAGIFLMRAGTYLDALAGACAEDRQGGEGRDGRREAQGPAHPARRRRLRRLALALDRLCGDGEGRQGRGRAGRDRLVGRRQLGRLARSARARRGRQCADRRRARDRHAGIA